jgi:glycosyltransferase involved in cell wall biosynthesis
MRIGFFVDLFYPYMLGGIEQRCYELSKRFIDSGDEVTVFTSSLVGSGSYEELFDGKLKIYRVGLIKNPLHRRNQWAFVGYVLSSYRLLNHVKNLDVLDVNQFSSFPGSIMSRILNIPSVYTIHDSGRIRLKRLPSFLLLKSVQFNIRQLLIITVSNEVKRKLTQNLRFRPDQIYVVPNGIDYQRIRKDVKGYGKHYKNRILYVGRLVQYKQVDHLITALSLLRSRGLEASLDIIGMGEEYENLKKLSYSLGLREKVRFYGYLYNKTQLFRRIAQADLFVNPSRHEGFGITLLEAMAAGTPVIAYDLPCYRDFTVNGVDSLLVKDMKPEKLAEAIETVIGKPRGQRFSSQALKTAERFDIQKIAYTVKNVYWKAINSTR